MTKKTNAGHPTFANSEKKSSSDGPEQSQPVIKLTRLDLNKMFNEDPPPPDYVLPGMLSGTVGIMVAAGSTGKSMWVLEAAMSIAAGRDVFGILGGNPVGGRVTYLCAEDQEPVLHARLHVMAQAIRAKHPQDAEGILGVIMERLDVVPVFGQGLTIKGLDDPDWGAAVKFCDGCRLVILDTLIRFAGGASENDNVEMGQLMSGVEKAVHASGSSFLLLHHVGKASARNGSAGGDQTATRGASSLTDNARWQANMATMSAEEGEKRGLDTAERRSYVSFEPTKTNYGPPVGAVWLHREAGGLLVREDPPEADDGQGRV